MSPSFGWVGVCSFWQFIPFFKDFNIFHAALFRFSRDNILKSSSSLNMCFCHCLSIQVFGLHCAERCRSRANHGPVNDLNKSDVESYSLQHTFTENGLLHVVGNIMFLVVKVGGK